MANLHKAITQEHRERYRGRILQGRWHRKVWGRELWVANSPLYCGKLLFLDAGYQSSLHRHIKKDETITVVAGAVDFELDATRRLHTVKVNESVHIRPLQWHRFSSHVGAIMAEFSTQHSGKDVERLRKSGPYLTQAEVDAMLGEAIAKAVSKPLPFRQYKRVVKALSKRGRTTERR